MLGHPNATAAVLTGMASSALLWALHRYAGITLSVRQSLAIVGGAISFILWVGRVGLQGAWLRIWHGTNAAVKAVVKGSPKPEPPPLA